MAAPIAHIFLALQMLAGPFKGMFDEQQFLVGTSFPDIRYLKEVKRTSTHVDGVTLEDITNETNSFRAGLLFHSFVDEQREKYVAANNLYDKVPKFRFTTQVLKFAEDKILRSIFDSAPFQSDFDGILQEERSYRIADTHIQRWHEFLQEYFKKEISVSDMLARFFDLHEPHAWQLKRAFFMHYYVPKIRSAIRGIVCDKEARALILNFYMNFSHIVTG